MDQDFHYYGTYYAARQGGFSNSDATLIAKASNFVDFFNEGYSAYWKLVRDTTKTANYQVVAAVDNPRFTVQANFTGMVGAPEDGLWCSFHFTPGNYDAPTGTPSHEAVHGKDVAALLPGFQKRDTSQGQPTIHKYNPDSEGDFAFGKMLNRPQSALSRQLIVDTIRCATDDSRLADIIEHAAGGSDILNNNREDNLRRFRLILLGLRAHVIADTWAHQDFSGLNNVMNTYWDVNYDPSSWDPTKWGYGRQSIDYNDGTSGWRNQVLSGVSAKVGAEVNHVISFLSGLSGNLEGAPNGVSYLGHGWMGHLPDFSFVKFRYKPCWANPGAGFVERDNPREYRAAWTELVSMFTQAGGKGRLKLDDQFNAGLQKAVAAIERPFDLQRQEPGRGFSAKAWQDAFGDLPASLPDANVEPDPQTVLSGMVEKTDSATRYGTDYVNIYSDLYLFQIAADYHFHFVQEYLARHGIYRFTGTWSQQTSALSGDLSALFADEAVAA
jgi:hypothetical protein